VEPDVVDRVGGPGSYALQADLMKRVYELVDFVDIKQRQQLFSCANIPSLPHVATEMNTAIGIEGNRCLPDVRLGVIRDAEVIR
jgi:hypothetical protein